jgi:uncharacterized cupredoxin-like copper-binding protein
MRPLPSFAFMLLVVTLVLGITSNTLGQTDNFCPPGQTPQFREGFALFKQQQGALVGDALECEHYDAQGNAHQKTTTGELIWTKSTNTVTFTPAGEIGSSETGLLQAADTPVQVSLVEWAIQMPDRLPAGSITFAVTNAGARQHNFEIEGQGIDEVLAQNLQPGESDTLTVELAPGEYRVYCPVGNHAGQGMELTLTVE